MAEDKQLSVRSSVNHSGQTDLPKFCNVVIELVCLAGAQSAVTLRFSPGPHLAMHTRVPRRQGLLSPFRISSWCCPRCITCVVIKCHALTPVSNQLMLKPDDSRDVITLMALA